MNEKICLITGANAGIGKVAALATSLNLKNTTGKYFDERNTIIESSKYSTDPANIKKVMDLTMKYL